MKEKKKGEFGSKQQVLVFRLQLVLKFLLFINLIIYFAH